MTTHAVNKGGKPWPASQHALTVGRPARHHEKVEIGGRRRRAGQERIELAVEIAPPPVTIDDRHVPDIIHVAFRRIIMGVVKAVQSRIQARGHHSQLLPHAVAFNRSGRWCKLWKTFNEMDKDGR